MRVEPFKPEHLHLLDLQPHQRDWQARIACEDFSALRGVTVFDDHGPVAVGGIADLGDGKGEAWALLGVASGRRMVALTRMAERGMRASGFRYLQALVAADFKPGKRWARLLGFTKRGDLPDYFTHGDAQIWTRSF